MTASPTITYGIAPPRAGFARHSLAVAVLAVGGTFCVAAAGLALWPEQASAASQTDTSMPQAAARAPVRLRCDTCGVVETIRHGEAADGAAAFYEFNVRLPDGSLRQSRDSQPGVWHVGDRMQLLGGDRTWSAF
jgi:hypothetical protein